MVIWSRIREDFPVLRRRIGGKQIVYFDSACMALKPKQVADAINYYYTELGACGGAGRSNHALGHEVSAMEEEARHKVARFFNANLPDEIIFTKNTTEALNLIAHTLGFKKGDNIVSTTLEHHSGVLPFWKQQRSGAELRLAKADPEGNLAIEEFEKVIDDNTKLVSVVHASNVTGTTSPLKEIVEIAHDHGALVVSDEAQYAAHHPLDVQEFDVDFMATSVHKMMGPSGQGILWGKLEHLSKMEPFMVGGDTITDVRYNDGMVYPEFLPPPHRFEAGLQDYAGRIGTGAAIDYLSSIGMKEIERREKQLIRKLLKPMIEFEERGDIKIIGPKDPNKRGALVSFIPKNISVRDAVLYLDDEVDKFRFMLRAGSHCVNPFHYSIGLNPAKGEGSLRASLYIYNEMWEIEKFVEELDSLLRMAK